jgi:hypothetical protein
MEPIHACFSLFSNKDDVIEDTELFRLAVALQCGDDEDGVRELIRDIFGLPSTQSKISRIRAVGARDDGPKTMGHGGNEEGSSRSRTS